MNCRHSLSLRKTTRCSDACQKCRRTKATKNNQEKQPTAANPQTPPSAPAIAGTPSPAAAVIAAWFFPLLISTSNRKIFMEPWIQTYSGKKFNPFQPEKDDISIVDIAHALSNVARFGGHTKRFYSVAEHSCFVVALLPTVYGYPKENLKVRRLLLAGLLHDASEAYIGDLVSPIKHTAEFKEFRNLENALQDAIFERFDCYPTAEDLQSINFVDYAALRKEAESLLPDPPLEDWHLRLPTCEMDYKTFYGFNGWSPKKAKAKYLEEFCRIQGM